MKKTTCLVLGVLVFFVGLASIGYPSSQRDVKFSLKNLEGLEKMTLSVHSRDFLERHGFAVSPGDEKEIYDVYTQAKKKNQPIFVTTDAVLHTCHIFFDYLLRVLEIERLYAHVEELTDRMIELSQNHPTA